MYNKIEVNKMKIKEAAKRVTEEIRSMTPEQQAELMKAIGQKHTYITEQFKKERVKVTYNVSFLDVIDDEYFDWEYDSLDEAIERINNQRGLCITHVEKITKEQV